MPRKSRVAKIPVVAQPETAEVRLKSPLNSEERAKLRSLLDEPAFVKAWRNASLSKPHFFPQGLDTAQGLQIGNNRLHQLQGWELFRSALLRESMEPTIKPTPAKDNYPQSGTIEAHVQSLNPTK